LRALRVSGPAQLALPVPGESSEHWWAGLPDHVRATVLTLLARLIARGVIADESAVGAGDE
jgi:hypothetical protein